MLREVTKENKKVNIGQGRGILLTKKEKENYRHKIGTEPKGGGIRDNDFEGAK